MAVDPTEFDDDLLGDGTDTLVQIDQSNLLNDEDSVTQADVDNNSGDFDQDVTVTGGNANAGDGIENGGGSFEEVGDDASISGSSSASADAEAISEGFTQDIDTGANIQSNALNAEIIGSNRSVDTTGEDDVADGDAPTSPEASLVGLSTSEADDAGTDVEFSINQSNVLSDTDTVTDPNVTNDDNEVDQNVTANGGTANLNIVNNNGNINDTGAIGIDIDNGDALFAGNVGDDLSISGSTSASADAAASAEAFTQEINVGENTQLNEININFVGGNQNIVETGEDDDEDIQLVADSEDDTEVHLGTGSNLVDGEDESIAVLSQSNELTDDESSGDDDGPGNSVFDATVVNTLNSNLNQTVAANGGVNDANMNNDVGAVTNDGIDTRGDDDAIIGDFEDAESTVGSNLEVSGSASATADATAAAEAFTQSIVTGGNVQQNELNANIVSGSQNIADVGEDNGGTASVNPGAAIADDGDNMAGGSEGDGGDDTEDGDDDMMGMDGDDAEKPVISGDTEVLANLSQSNDISDNDEIINARVVNGDIGEGPFNGGASVTQIVDADGGSSAAEDGIDADGLEVDAISVSTGDDATVSGSSSTSADAVAEATAFTQDLTTGGNVQINLFNLDVVGGTQSSFTVGEDDTENPAAVLADEGVTVTTVEEITQSNVLSDVDVLGAEADPGGVASEPVVFNDAGSTLVQTVTANGGSANSDDGITLVNSDEDFMSSSLVGDDLDISGSSSASADATASATAFTQNLSTGDNTQSNSMNVAVVGASQTTTSVGGDNAGVPIDDAVLQLDDNLGDTHTTVHGSQSNNLTDTDTINDAEVINDSDFGAEIGGSVMQTATAIGSQAPGDGPSGDADGIDATGLGGAIFNGSTEDDASISGSTSATADANASAVAFTQDIVTGDNLQSNAASISVVDANEIVIDTGEDEDEGVAATVGNSGAAITHVELPQTNTLSDSDIVDNPKVSNGEFGTSDADGSTVNQTATATGGDNSSVDNGIALGDGDVALVGSIGDDLAISGDASASADATAAVEAFTQDIDTGENVQVNSASVSVIGGSSIANSVGGDDGAAGDSATALDDDDLANDTDTKVVLNQTNNLAGQTGSDEDTVEDADVFAEDDSDVMQTANASGGEAIAQDGIGNADGAQEANVGAILTGVEPDGMDDVGGQILDDASVAGATSASADASASLEAFTQDINTGDNTQLNNASINVIGDSSFTNAVGEDDDGAETFNIAVDDLSTTNTNVNLNQENILNDADRVEDPDVIASSGSDLDQTANVAGGNASAGDGIGNNANVIGDVTIDDDAAVSGSADASADADATLEAFTQDVTTGGNNQFNTASINVVGDANAENSTGGDDEGAEEFTLGLSDLSPTNTTINLSQTNRLNDSENDGGGEFNAVDTADVVAGIDSSVTQDANVNFGDIDPVTAISGDGIGGDTGAGVIQGSSIGDDASIDGATSASADASASLEAFTQDISTGSNTQVNSASISVVGDANATNGAGEDDAGADVFSATDDLGADENVGTTTTIETLTQSNILNDVDEVDDPTVFASFNAEVTQTADVNGGDATAGSGVNSDGGLVIESSVGDDLDASGSASASADAAATLEAFTQDIVTGDNTQINTASISIVGGSNAANNVGDDDAGEDMSVVMDPPAGGDETGGNDETGNDDNDNDDDPIIDQTLTSIPLVQSNALNDSDDVIDPEVFALEGSFVSQTGNSTGGDATSGDGISTGDGGILYAVDIEDDASVAGSTSASADASVSLEAFTQDITTGGNTQFNIADISIVGGSSASALTGEDDLGTGDLLGNLATDALGDTDSSISISQSNGGRTEGSFANDMDEIFDPNVFNDAGNGANNGLEGLNQQATANNAGATATSGNGISTSGTLVDGDIGDDGAVSGAAAASTAAGATAEGFTQDLTTGENRQGNSAEASVVGANANSNATGDDDNAGGDEFVFSGLAGNADTYFDIDQSNRLNDEDEVLGADVTTSSSGDTVTTTIAVGGVSSAGNGISVTGENLGEGTTVDDLAITGETIASADAVSTSEVFTQDISTGGNVQTNASDLSVVGLNDNLFFTGEDDGDDASDLMPSEDFLSPINLEVVDPEGNDPDADGVDTTFDIMQVNSLIDTDTVTNPDVTTAGGSTFTDQNVTAMGGDATTGDGIVSSDANLFSGYSVLDDLSIEGVSAASADAFGATEAFTQNIVVGANVQVNAINVSVVGGSSTVNTVGEDDLA